MSLFPETRTEVLERLDSTTLHRDSFSTEHTPSICGTLTVVASLLVAVTGAAILDLDDEISHCRRREAEELEASQGADDPKLKTSRIEVASYYGMILHHLLKRNRG